MEKLLITQDAMDLIHSNGVTDVHINPMTPRKKVEGGDPVKLNIGSVYMICIPDRTYIIVISELPDGKYEVLGSQGIYAFNPINFKDVWEMHTESALISCNNNGIYNDTDCYYNGERIASCREIQTTFSAMIVKD